MLTEAELRDLLGRDVVDGQGKTIGNLETFFKDVSGLRNALAHANDILSGGWPDLADLVTSLEDFLERLEAISTGG